jgi:hypothetical protein
MNWRSSAFILLCAAGAAQAAPMTAADAIAIAQKACAKQIPDHVTLIWSAFPIGGGWGVEAAPEDKEAPQGWAFTVPDHGPLPDACVPYTIKPPAGGARPGR